MKSLLVFLCLVICLLAFVLWKSQAAAGAAEAAAAAASTTFSNQLAEANLKITHQERLAAVAQAKLAERCDQAAALSNTVAILKADSARLLLRNQTSEADARGLRMRLSVAEADAAELSRKLDVLKLEVQRLSASLQTACSNEKELKSSRMALLNETECLKIEKVELARQLNNPHVLRLRLAAFQAGFQPLLLRTNGSVAESARLQKAMRKTAGSLAQ